MHQMWHQWVYAPFFRSHRWHAVHTVVVWMSLFCSIQLWLLSLSAYSQGGSAAPESSCVFLDSSTRAWLATERQNCWPSNPDWGPRGSVTWSVCLNPHGAAVVGVCQVYCSWRLTCSVTKQQLSLISGIDRSLYLSPWTLPVVSPVCSSLFIMCNRCFDDEHCSADNVWNLSSNVQQCPDKIAF